MDEDYPELNTESDTTLEQPDLDQLRQDRLDRNRKFLQSVSSSTAARVLPQDGSEGSIDVRGAAAIIIQKHWKRVMAKNIYVAMLYEKYMKEEEEQSRRTRQQMEEGELLVENHELEVLLDDNKTTRRNAERRLISKVITIQRWWKTAIEKKKKKVSLMSDKNEIQGHQSDSNLNLQGNLRSPQRSGHRNPFNYSEDSEIGDKTENVDDGASFYMNPVCDSANDLSTSLVEATLKRLPRETAEDYQRRVRKQSLLSQAHQFILLKKENSDALPFNLHMQGKDLGSMIVETCNHIDRMDTTSKIGDCETCDLNRNSSKEIPKQTEGVGESVSNKERGDVDDKRVGESGKCDPETKGGNKGNPNEKGDNKLSNASDCAFDVYNIETALPDLDWKTMEEKLIAARKEEDERLKKTLKPSGLVDWNGNIGVFNGIYFCIGAPTHAPGISS